MLFATVTICTPGTNACQTIDHMQVDTGSWGVQVVSEVLNGAAVPTQLNDPATNAPLRECVQFADGYTWGSVVLVDVIIGGRTISNLPVHLIGDAAAGAAPASCVANLTPENTVVDFGANGLLGIGNFLQDCGQTCVTQVIPALYYVCPPQQSCQETTVALQNQLQNPIGALTGGDSNGVVISLPAVSAPGQATVSGTVYFGISTQANNDLGSAMLFTLDGMGDLITQFNGNTLTSSFIDSGSNGYFFNYNITQCSSTLSPGFYCPASPVPLSATIQGQNGNTATVKFTVDNADALAQSGDAANPGRAGPNNAPNGPTNGFDWGLPFFFGRSVYVLFETYTVNGTTGPAVGF